MFRFIGFIPHSLFGYLNFGYCYWIGSGAYCLVLAHFLETNTPTIENTMYFWLHQIKQ